MASDSVSFALGIPDSRTINLVRKAESEWKQFGFENSLVGSQVELPPSFCLTPVLNPDLVMF